MFRLLIMCLLGLSGVFFETSGTRASPMGTRNMETMSMAEEAEGMSVKSKRHNFHVGKPCPQSSSHSGTYLPSAGLSGHHATPEYEKPFVIPSYHHVPKVESISYQKPVIPKMIYQTIQRPAIHHAAYNVQPVAKQHVQYVQQQTYMPQVKELPISYVKSVAPEVSYKNVQKLFTSYVKPVQHVQPVQTIHPVKPFVKEIPCEHAPAPAPAPAPVFIQKPIGKPVMEMHSRYSKQFFQPISHNPKPMIQPDPISTFFPHVNKFNYPTTKVIYQKPKVQISQPHPIIKVAPAPAPEPGCEKLHQPEISYVKTPQPIVHTVHQPMFQYAPKYHQPIVHQQPMIHFEQKIHQPTVVQQPLFHFTQKIHQPQIVQQPLFHISPKIHQPIAMQNEVMHYTQPIVYGNAQHSVSTVAPPIDYHGHNYQSVIIGVNQPCHK